jgi:hypothetical protein
MMKGSYSALWQEVLGFGLGVLGSGGGGWGRDVGGEMADVGAAAE